jgi:hypothetical protein
MTDRILFEPRSLTWRVDGEWEHLPWKRNTAGMYGTDIPEATSVDEALARPSFTKIAEEADPIAAADVVDGVPEVTVQGRQHRRHVYPAGQRYGVSEAVAGELRAAGHGSCIAVVEVRPIQVVSEVPDGFVGETAAEAALRAKIAELEDRIASLEPKRIVPKKQPAA